MISNGIFELLFDDESGKVTSLRLVGDPNSAEFIKQGRGLGEIHGFPWLTNAGKVQTYRNALEGYEYKEGSLSERQATAVFERRGISVTETFTLRENDLLVTLEVKNGVDYPVYFNHEDFSVFLPFVDSYDSSEISTKTRCHEHIADCGENSYVRVERMGESDYNLGVIFLTGDVRSYSQEDVPNSNDRGYFLVNFAPFSLLKGESRTFSFAVFAHRGSDDFFKRIKKYPEYLHVEAKKGYTLYKKEKREFTITASSEIKKATVSCEGKKLPVKIEGNTLTAVLFGKTTGEKKVEYEVNGRTGFALFNVTLPLTSLTEKRLAFITEKQQCLDKKSPLYGAFLVYDTQEKAQYYSYSWRDQNACRERIGMGLLLAKYLRKKKNAKFRASLDKYTAFILREVVDEQTGRVFDSINKHDQAKRLYNAPWFMEYFYELYKLTGKEKHLKLASKIMTYFYEAGGTRFYPNAVHFSDVLLALKAVGWKEEYEKNSAYFDEHANNIVKTGVYYPPHEVNFEQTIVAPAVTVLLDKYYLSDDVLYLKEAEKHLAILKKFDGCQPDYHRNKVPVRYWDDFWFGKAVDRVYGDTFPHYWSCLTGDCFAFYGRLTGDERQVEYGRQTLDNCLCLFNEKGEGSCAYVYPQRVNGVKGKFFDAYANDQDFALYFALRYQDKI